MPRTTSSTAAKRGSMRDRKRKKAHDRRQQGGLDCLILPEGVNFYKPVAGNNLLDIVPYEIKAANSANGKPGELYDELEYWVHRNVGPEDKMVVCLKKTFGKRCPICDRANEMANDRNADAEEVKAMWPKRRMLYNVIDLNGKEEDVKIWDVSHYLFSKVLDEELDFDESGKLAGYPDLQEGMTLKVRMNEKSLGTNKFLETTKIDFQPRDDYEEDVVQDATDLDACLKVLTYEELEALFLGTEDELPEEGDTGPVVPDNDPPPPSGRRRRGGGDPPPPQEPLPPTTRRRGATPPPDDPPPDDNTTDGETTEGTCPEGFTWGVACDTDDKCRNCGDEWNACRDAKDQLDRDATAAENAKKKAGASSGTSTRRRRR